MEVIQRKLRILFVLSGPAMSIKRDKFLMLSKYFCGSILSYTGNKELFQVKDVGDFTYHPMKITKKNSFLVLRYVLFCLLFVIKEKINKNKYDIVVTYDPLKTGLIGCICNYILKTIFIPEVNGVYTSNAEYMDDAHKISTKMKKWFYPKIEKIVLKRAHGVKLLFPKQIEPFSSVTKGKIIHNFANFIDVEPFLNHTNTIIENVVLFVGFPFYRKGVDILISAFKKIAGDYPTWKLKLLGWYPDLTLLNNTIAGHPQIFHHPPVYPKEMPLHLASCSFLVLPSRSEAMGRILIEAMAAGKARIGAAVDGIPTVIEDEVDGLLFKPEDIDDLSTKMRKLIEDENLRLKLGNRGKQRAINELNTENYIDRVQKFYTAVYEHENGKK